MQKGVRCILSLVLHHRQQFIRPVYRAHRFRPLDCNRGCRGTAGSGCSARQTHAAHGWQMPSVSVDALHQAVTDVRAPLWTATLHHTTVFLPPRPAEYTTACLADAASTHTHPYTPTHAFLLPSVIHITSDSHHSGNRWITCSRVLTLLIG